MRNWAISQLDHLLNGDDKLKNILLGAITTLISKGIYFIVTLVSVPLVYNYLNKDKFGVYMTILSFIGLLSFSDLGLGYGLLNKIASFHPNQSKASLIKAISSTFFFLCFISISFLVLILTISNHLDFASIFNIKEGSYNREIHNGILTFFICFLVSLPFSIITKIQIGFQQTHKNKIWEIFSSACSLLAIYYCTNKKLGIPYLILASYGTTCLFTLLNFIYQFSSTIKEYRPHLSMFDKLEFQLLLKEGLIFFFLQLLAILVNTTDSLLIARYLSPSDVTEYSIGFRIISILIMPVQSFIGPFLPALNSAISSNDKKWINEKYLRLISPILIITLLMMVGLIVFGNSLIHVWISHNLSLTFYFWIGMGLLLMYTSIDSFFSSIMLTKQWLRTTLKLYPIATILTLLIKILLIQQFGVVALLVTPLVIFTLFYFYPAYQRIQMTYND